MLCRSLPSHECVSCRADCFVCCYVERVRAVETTCVCHEDEMESASAHQLLSRVCMCYEDNVESASVMKTRWRACLMECRRGGVA